MWLFLVMVTMVGKLVQAGNTTGSDGLRCYACADTAINNNMCEDYNTYKQAMDGTDFEKVKKNCTPPYDKVCIIETFEGLGNTISHIRDCSDGIHFSFTKAKKTGTYKRLTDLIPNNETACVWDGLHQVCLSQCDTDFCNGPQLEEKNSAMWMQPTKHFILLVFVFITNSRNYVY